MSKGGENAGNGPSPFLLCSLSYLQAAASCLGLKHQQAGALHRFRNARRVCLSRFMPAGRRRSFPGSVGGEEVEAGQAGTEPCRGGTPPLPSKAGERIIQRLSCLSRYTRGCARPSPVPRPLSPRGARPALSPCAESAEPSNPPAPVHHHPRTAETAFGCPTAVAL
jgi:hypothetical protein